MSPETLFNLGFDHWQAFLLSFIPALITLVAIIYFWRFPSYRINRVYLLYLFGILSWQVNDSLARMSLSEETARSWDRLLAIGWLLQFPSTIHFAFLLTGKKKIASRPWFILLLYFPTGLIGLLLCSGLFQQPFVYSPFWGWVRTYTNLNTYVTAAALWVGIEILFNIFPLGYFAYAQRKSADVKTVSLFIFIGYIVPALTGVTTQIVYPLFLGRDPVPITSTLMVTIVLVIIEIKAYKIFILSETIETEQITEMLQEMIFVVTPQQAVTYINSYAAKQTGLKRNTRTTLKDLFSFSANAYQRFEKNIFLPACQKQKASTFQFTLYEQEDKERYWEVTTYPISNTAISSLLVVCRDVTERVLLAEAQLSALRSQMNPHFIFNALNSIQNYVHSYQRESAESFLSTFSVLIRQILDNSTKTFISLSEEIQMLRLYLTLEKARFGERLQYDITVANDLEPDDTLLPSMLIQPYIENAILHGLAPKSKGGKVTIELKKKDDILLCTVTDDGVGREKAMALKKVRHAQHKSHGMNITKMRLDLLNLYASTPVSVTLLDQYDNKQPCGTIVEIQMPLNERF